MKKAGDKQLKAPLLGAGGGGAAPAAAAPPPPKPTDDLCARCGRLLLAIGCMAVVMFAILLTYQVIENPPHPMPTSAPTTAPSQQPSVAAAAVAVAAAAAASSALEVSLITTN